jgi:hypothetical protein
MLCSVVGRVVLDVLKDRSALETPQSTHPATQLHLLLKNKCVRTREFWGHSSNPISVVLSGILESFVFAGVMIVALWGFISSLIKDILSKWQR